MNSFPLPLNPLQDQIARQSVVIQKAMIRLLNNDDTMSLMAQAINEQRAYLNTQHPFYQLIEAYSQFNIEIFNQSFSNKVISPYVLLLIQSDVFVRVKDVIELYREKNGYLSININAIEDIYWLIDGIKLNSHPKSFKTAVATYHRKYQYDNFNAYSNYTRALFKRHARLLIIRVDLGYHKDFVVSYEHFRDEVSQFIARIQSNPLFKDLLGYIWKLEHGNDKGYHVHLMFFYDSSKKRGDCYYGQQIGELWQQITQGHGIYFNCNTQAQKDRYIRCYLGQVHRSETDKIDTLIDKGIGYLTKVDEYLRLTKTDNSRLIGKGELKHKK